MKILFVALVLAVTTLSAKAENLWQPNRGVSIQSVPPGIVLQPLLKLANDRDAKVSNQLSLMLDSANTVQGMYNEELRSSAENTIFTPADGISWLRDIESNEGSVLFEGQGKKVIFIQGKLDRATQEGRFNIRFLTNGLRNTYEACDLLLKKDDKGWFVLNAYTNKRVTDAKIITWSLGITSIQGVCPKTF